MTRRRSSNGGGEAVEPRVERRAVAALRPHPENPRTHPDEQVDGLGASFNEFGVLQFPVIDETGMILAGEGRWRAAVKQGRAELPVIVVEGWSVDKKRAFMVADNRWAMLGGFDQAKLRAAVHRLQTANFSLSVVGYTLEQATELLATGTEGLVDPDEIPRPVANPIVRPGDVWVLGGHRLICGDSCNAATVSQLFGSDRPVLMVTDPPYGVSYEPLWREGLGRAADGSAQRVTSGRTINRFRANAVFDVVNDDRADWTEAWQLFPGDVCYIWHASLRVGQVQLSIDKAGFVPRAHIIWNKQNQVFSRGDYHWKHEPCWYAVRRGRPGRWAGDRRQTTVWDIANHNPMGGNRDEEQTGHGTQKPVECMARPIRNSSRAGQLVYDPFVGSGTTVIAAEMEGRRCLAVELNPVFAEMVIERWQRFTGRDAVLDDKTFNEVAAQRRRPARGKKRHASSRGRKSVPGQIEQPAGRGGAALAQHPVRAAVLPRRRAARRVPDRVAPAADPARSAE